MHIQYFFVLNRQIGIQYNKIYNACSLFCSSTHSEPKKMQKCYTRPLFYEKWKNMQPNPRFFVRNVRVSTVNPLTVPWTISGFLELIHESPPFNSSKNLELIKSTHGLNRGNPWAIREGPVRQKARVYGRLYSEIIKPYSEFSLV